MTTPIALNLNYYSKHNRARQKKNISSLYTLLPTNNTHTGSSQQFRLKIHLPRQNKTIRKQQFEHFLNSKQSQRNFEGLNTLHQSQRQQILSYIQMSSYYSSKSILNPTQSKICCAQSNKFQSSSHNSQIRQLKSYKTAKQRFKKLSFDENDDENEDLAQSFQVGQEQNLSQNPYSVVIARIDLNFHRFQSKRQEDEVNLNRYLLLEPLQPQLQCSYVSQSSLHQLMQKQSPDKLSAFQSQYDQNDFNDLINSPIENLKKQAEKQIFMQQFASQKMIQTVSLEEMLVRINKSNQNITNNEAQRVVMTPKQIEKDKNVIIEEQVPIKKVNFKALINRNKSIENENNNSFRKERNKKLLLNFFDEN